MIDEKEGANKFTFNDDKERSMDKRHFNYRRCR